MFRGLSRIFVLTWLVTWFGYVMPCHERGAVAIAGASVAGCCDRPPNHHGPSPVNDPVRRCAVCRITAVLQTAPPFHWTLPRPTLLALLPVRVQSDLTGNPALTAPLGRDPPASFPA
jgi:hypothetical protein